MQALFSKNVAGLPRIGSARDVVWALTGQLMASRTWPVRQGKPAARPVPRRDLAGGNGSMQPRSRNQLDEVSLSMRSGLVEYHLELKPDGVDGHAPKLRDLGQSASAQEFLHDL